TVHLGEAAQSDAAVARMADVLQGDSKAALYRYPGAGDGFATQGAVDYVRPAALLAYSRSLSLLRRVLGPAIDLEALWGQHLSYEFGVKDPDATIDTMVADCYVNHVPTMTGGSG